MWYLINDRFVILQVTVLWITVENKGEFDTIRHYSELSEINELDHPWDGRKPFVYSTGGPFVDHSENHAAPLRYSTGSH